MINVAIGDAAIEYEGREYILRPSFYAMQRIGSPEEIKEIAELCYSALARKQAGFNNNHYEINACYHVLTSCGGDDIPVELYGYFDDNGEGMPVFIEGVEPVGKMIVIANHLISKGMNGNPSAYMMRRGRSSGAKLELFNPIDYVSSAVSHLGLSFNDAWTMTMIELQRAIESKFPQSEKQKQSMMNADELRDLKKKIKRG